MGHLLREPVVRLLTPALARAVALLDDRFTIVSVERLSEGKAMLRFGADLRHPVQVGSQRVSPLARPGVPAPLQVDCDASAVLEYCMLQLIVVLAWPAAQWRELAVRLAISVPLAAVLLLLDIPFGVVADLWGLLIDNFAPGTFSPWRLWSFVMLDGGGLMLALVFGAIAIEPARMLCAVPRGSVLPQNSQPS